MKDWILSRATGLVLPVVLGPLAFVLTQWLKKSIAALDAASPSVKQAVVMALSFVLAGLVKFAGTYLPPLCDAGADAVGCLSAITDPQAMQGDAVGAVRVRAAREPAAGKDVVS
jgi:uncharacterized membrane protein YphA (DoxX/SURF4 family)